MYHLHLQLQWKGLSLVKAEQILRLPKRTCLLIGTAQGIRSRAWKSRPTKRANVAEPQGLKSQAFGLKTLVRKFWLQNWNIFWTCLNNGTVHLPAIEAIGKGQKGPSLKLLTRNLATSKSKISELRRICEMFTHCLTASFLGGDQTAFVRSETRAPCDQHRAFDAMLDHFPVRLSGLQGLVTPVACWELLMLKLLMFNTRVFCLGPTTSHYLGFFGFTLRMISLSQLNLV